MRELRASRGWLPWLGALAVGTLAMLAARPRLDRAHAAPLYLLLVVLASARAGRIVGISVAVLAFLALNYFFVPPFHTLVVSEPFDWLVLLAFLVTSAVAAQLLARAQAEAAAARRRAEEVDRLSVVGAEALNAGRAEEALLRIAEVIRGTLGLRACELYLRDQGSGGATLAARAGDAASPDERDGARDDPSTREFRLPSGLALVEWVAANGRAVLERADGGTQVSTVPAREGATTDLTLTNARTVVLPLRVGERIAGVARLVAAGALTLDEPQRRFLEALLYYAALGVERVRLSAEAEHAEALRQADALKDALMASVSHDLRTPLTTIKALAQAIRREGDDRAATIEEEADRLNRFVADLLDLSRLAGGALTVTPEITAAEDLVGAALQRVSGVLNGHALDVVLPPGDPLLLGRFDFVHSLRILVNLIENAIKYSPDGAAVELRVRRAGDALEIEVADRGPGVPPAERERIFDAFYRPTGSAPDVGGAGLGLSIARRLAEAQHGSLHHEARDGGGSRFVLRLPAADLADMGVKPNAVSS